VSRFLTAHQAIQAMRQIRNDRKYTN